MSLSVAAPLAERVRWCLWRIAQLALKYQPLWR